MEKAPIIGGLFLFATIAVERILWIDATHVSVNNFWLIHKNSVPR